MAEYIGREDLIRRLELSIKSWGRDCNSNAPVIVRTYQDVLHRVKNIPSADVAKVRHEHWDENIIGFCNVCMGCGAIVERTAIKNRSGELNYCPNCGAKMDEKGTHPTKIDK